MVLLVFSLFVLLVLLFCLRAKVSNPPSGTREPMFSAMAAPPILHKYLLFRKISKTLHASHSQPSRTFEIWSRGICCVHLIWAEECWSICFHYLNTIWPPTRCLWRAIWGPRQSLCVISTPNGWRQPAALHMILAEDVKSFIILFIKLYSHKTEKLQRYASIKI